MTEAKWLACADPIAMLDQLHTLGLLGPRRWRLFAVACCGRIRPLLTDERSRVAVEMAERFADDLASVEELGAVYEAAFDAHFDLSEQGQHRPAIASYAAREAADCDERAHSVAWEAAAAAGEPAEPPAQCQLLRDIFGNPFRPVNFAPEWRTDTATAIARQMYESRDFSAMPILTDALQDAGCDADDILNHCRDPHAAHVRGCWVVDLVLGKS